MIWIKEKKLNVTDAGILGLLIKKDCRPIVQTESVIAHIGISQEYMLNVKNRNTD